MTHEGRMTRGEANYKVGLLDNEDTKYYIKEKKINPVPPKEELKVSEEKPKKKKYKRSE